MIFRKNIISIYSKLGEKWLSNLPETIAHIADKYDISNIEPLPNLTHNFVALGYQKHKPIILKLGLDHDEIASEIRYMNAADENIMPKIISSAPGMIIMERAIPGTPLKGYVPSYDDHLLTDIFCNLVEKLHKTKIPDNHEFKSLKGLLSKLEQNWNIPEDILNKAKSFARNLLNSSHNQVLLHGDLHHENILKHEERWIAIDPKGYIGDPAFDIASYIYNPMDLLPVKSNLKKLIHKNIDLCARNLLMDKQRIHDWLYVKIVLCWIWSIEDNTDTTYWQNFLSIIDE